MFKKLKELGPGVLIAAAFIGPGTVTVCTISGASYGYTLLWAMLLSVGVTLLLQEMSLRLGIISGKDLSQLIRIQIKSNVLRNFSIALILSAIFVGNAAYEAGNISGGAIGLSAVFPNSVINIGDFSFNFLNVLIGVIAFLLLFIGKYKLIEKGLVSLVILMTVSFIVTAVLTEPDLQSIASGLFIPKVPENNFLIVVALIGTTVVPYNLFLHSSLVGERWKSKNDLKTAQIDSFISITLGGLVSMAIIISAAAIKNQEINQAIDLAKGLEPLYGKFATYFMALGLFAAGTTSAITAPFAAAYVVNGCLGWNASIRSAKFRIVWMVVLISGVIFSLSNFKPLQIIIFAQFSNGILLPVITGYLIWITSKKSILGNHNNSTFQNVLAVGALIITLILSFKSIGSIFGFFA